MSKVSKSAMEAALDIGLENDDTILELAEKIDKAMQSERESADEICNAIASYFDDKKRLIHGGGKSRRELAMRQINKAIEAYDTSRGES